MAHSIKLITLHKHDIFAIRFMKGSTKHTEKRDMLKKKFKNSSF